MPNPTLTVIKATRDEGYRHFHDLENHKHPETVEVRDWSLHYEPATDIFTEDVGTVRIAAFRGRFIDRKGLH